MRGRLGWQPARRGRGRRVHTWVLLAPWRAVWPGNCVQGNQAGRGRAELLVWAAGMPARLPPSGAALTPQWPQWARSRDLCVS